MRETIKINRSAEFFQEGVAENWSLISKLAFLLPGLTFLNPASQLNVATELNSRQENRSKLIYATSTPES